MASTGPNGQRGRSAWREVIMAWAAAAVLAGVLAVAMAKHDDSGAPASAMSSLTPAAGGHVHKKAMDDEGPASEEACSDRDYANERC
jgi:hypothetical protein